MEKLKMHSLDKLNDNILKIGKLFPNCVTERKNEKGEVERAIDFDMLRQELSKDIVEGNEERYQFTWPDKKQAMRLANLPINKTLRPCREESVDFDNTQNLYIEGDNLEVLKLLQETYLGKIKMIYIDPPYNTGNDFVYEDDFTQSAEEYFANSGQQDEEGNRLVQNTESNGRFHTDWLNMMYPRLKLAKDLLSDDGVIFISIDDNEVDNLSMICNEIFGGNGFVAKFIWEKKKKPSFLNVNIGIKTEYVLAYAKNRSKLGALSVDVTTAGKKYPLNNAGNAPAILVFPPNSVLFSIDDSDILPQDMSEGNIVTKLLTPVKIVNGYNQDEFSLYGEWRYSQNKLNEIISAGESITVSKIPFRPNHIKVGGEVKKAHNMLSIANYNVGTNEDATNEFEEIFGKSYFDYAKPVGLVEFLTKAVSYMDNEVIVMDFFSGSATTAHSVMQLNAKDGGKRKFIMVQLPEGCDEKSEAFKAGYKNICEIGKERIRRAGKKIKEDTPLTTQDLDIGFRVLKCDSSNIKDVYYTPNEYTSGLFDVLADNIKEDRTPEDLLFQVMLDLGVLLSSKIEAMEIGGKHIFNVENRYLMACFDSELTDEVITEIAKMQPYYFVMRDSSMASDSVAANFEQIFNTYSPNTVRRVL